LAIDRKKLIPALILLAGAVAFAALKATRPTQAPAKVEERVWRVEVLEAQPQTLSPTLTLYGQVETPDLLRASAPATAVVQTVHVREGDPVRKGQPLIQLDPRDFEPRVEEFRAEAAELEAEIASERRRYRADLESLEHEKEILALSNASVRRAEQLKTKNLGSEAALDEARQTAARQALLVTSREYEVDNHATRLESLQAKLARARAKLADAELDLERSRLSAPFDGIVAKVMVAEGDQVRDSDVMLEMYSVESLEVRARIPAPYRAELQESLVAGGQVVGRADRNGSAIQLRLERFSGEADPSGIDGLFNITAGRQWLRVGEMVEFQLQRPPREQAFALPYQALYGGDRIYLLEDGRLRGVRVQALGSYVDGDREEQLLVTSDQISDGDTIVVTHLPNAITGLRAAPVER
jgi:multidrug efflux pump subunit AcrA (membrane-fusion protein)